MSKKQKIRNTTHVLTGMNFGITHKLDTFKTVIVDEAFTISYLEGLKNNYDRQLEMARNMVKDYKTLPKTLTEQFELAAKRKMVIKGLMTKEQNKLKAKLGL